MKPKISKSDLCRNAKRIRTGVAEIKTFLAVETKNTGFDSQDRPLILFERHWFHRFTKGKYDRTHPNISNSKAGGYGTSASQYGRFNQAYALDKKAALKSASWGLGQVMGFNYPAAGYGSVEEFVSAMRESEGKQLDASINFIIHNGLDDELRRHDWKGFARGYNGAAYKKNAYDTKLATAYRKYSKEKTNCDEVDDFSADFPDSGNFEEPTLTPEPEETPDFNFEPTPEPDVDEVDDDIAGDPPKPGEPAPDIPAQPGEAVVGGRPQDPPKIIDKAVEKTPQGWRTWPTTITATLSSIGLSITGMLSWFSGALSDPKSANFVMALAIIGLVGAAIFALFYLINRAITKSGEAKRAHEVNLKQLELQSMPNRYNVKLDGRQTPRVPGVGQPIFFTE